MFNKKIKYLIFIFLAITFLNVTKVSGQYYAWQMLRYEFYFGGGVTNFMGDVGAPINNNSFNSNVWVNKQAVRWVGQTGLKMALGDRSKIRGNLAIGMLYNDDRYGNWPDSIARYLNFQSLIVELGAHYELYLIPDRRWSFNKYSRWINTPKAWRNLLQPVYMFAGVGGIYFNPKGYTNGKWHSLQPLYTEGVSYSRISAVAMGGLGIKIRVARYHSLFVEAGWRLAFTDYLDDVSVGELRSTDYMREHYGELAAILFYRNHNEQNHPAEGFQGGPGTGRGGDWFDQYQFITLNYAITLKANQRNRPTFKIYKANED